MTDPFLPPDPAGREDEDPLGLVFRSVPVDGGVHVTVEPLPNDATHPDDGASGVLLPGPDAPRDTIHPVLQRWLAGVPHTKLEQLIVVFTDTERIPRFPEPAVKEPRDSERNRRRRARVEELVGTVRENRDAQYEDLIRALEGIDRRIRILARYWLINALLIEAPLRVVPALAQIDVVQSIEPRFTGERPPNNEIDDGRARIGSDPYFNLGLTSGWIALLDTGVRSTHRVFTNPSHLNLRRDCINGGADCNTGTGLDPLDNDPGDGHGTPSAAILTANCRRHNNFRGVTAAQVDSFRIYGALGLDQAAALNGYQTATKEGEDVIVVEAQDAQDYGGALSTAGDHAFDCGAVVVAANGNEPDVVTVASPANAHRVLGVGAYDVVTGNLFAQQACGPTGDSRVKPDLQCPTNTQAAGKQTDTSTTEFRGTSGATPYAGGAAALARSWLRDHGGTIDPGQVHAQLVLFSDPTGAGPNVEGAGRLLMRDPATVTLTWGKVSVPHGMVVDVPVPVAATSQTLGAAIWWPENLADQHNTVTLALLDPSGAVRQSSSTPGSVFERCAISGGVAPPGNWLLRVRGFNVPVTPQTVYWAASVQ